MRRADLIDKTISLILDDGINTSFFRSKSFLVSGGAGFLGSWISESICKMGGTVYCVDDFSTSPETNVDHLRQHQNFHLISENIITADLSAINCDFVFHLASRPSPEDYQLHPVESLLPNSTGSEKLLSYCKERRIPIALASTSEVYGDAKIIPTPESYWGNVNPVGLRSCYDEGKRYAEALFMAYSRQYGVPVKIFRIFNTYGPRLRADGYYGRAVSRFLMQASSDKDITIFGDGKQTRSFCFVSDTVRGILYFAQSTLVNEVINVGNPEEMTILQLAQVIKEVTNSKSDVVFAPPAPDDPRRRCPDITKANQLLSWSPYIDLRAGIQMTLDWNTSS